MKRKIARGAVFALAIFSRAYALPWSPMAHIPVYAPARVIAASRPLCPILAAYPYAQEEWGGPVIGAGPESLESVKPLDISPRIVGGLCLTAPFAEFFAGARVAGGFAFDLTAPVIPFVAADATLYYLHDEPGTGLDASGVMVAGISGARPIPWAVVAKGVKSDTDGSPRMELAGEFASPTFNIADFISVRAALAAGLAFSEVSESWVGLLGRVSCDFEGRRYSNAMATGLAAHLIIEGEWFPDGDIGRFMLRTAVAGGWQYASFGGLAGRLYFGYDSSNSKDWSSPVRLAVAGPSRAGDLGLGGGIELPFLFAKGRLFRSDDLAAAFLISLFSECFVLRPKDGELFAAENTQLDFGVEVAMHLVRHPRQVFRVAAGFELSAYLKDPDNYAFTDCLVALAAMSLSL